MPRDFYDLSPRQFSLMMQGYQDKKIDSYKQTRLLMFTMVRLMGDSKTAPKTPEALWELPGDESVGVSKDDMRDMFKRLQK
jgi:hypothetical protein